MKDNNELEHLKNNKITMEEIEVGRQAIIFVSFADVYWECYALKSSHDIMRISCILFLTKGAITKYIYIFHLPMKNYLFF